MKVIFILKLFYSEFLKFETKKLQKISKYYQIFSGTLHPNFGDCYCYSVQYLLTLTL